MIMSGRFTAEELHAAAKRMSSAVGMITGGMTTPAPWTVTELRDAAIGTGYNQVTLGQVIENARAHRTAVDAAFEKIASAPIAELRGSEQALAGEDDVISARELREALRKIIGWSATTSEYYANQILNHTAKHREPEYSPGTVVKDAKNVLYKRTTAGNWITFGTSHLFDHDYPARPLEVT